MKEDLNSIKGVTVCTKCGKKFDDKYQFEFCGKCGTRLSDAK